MRTTTTSTAEEKDDPSIPPAPPENWDRCHAYLERKRRFCRQRPNDSSSIYCGNHQHLEVQENNDASERRKRIPCPLDPSHMIFEDMVEKHIIICPRAKKRKRQTEQIYYQENINTGGSGSTSWPNASHKAETSCGTVTSLEWAQRLAIRVLQAHQRIFHPNNSKAPSRLTWEDLHDAIPLTDLSQPEMNAGMEEGFKIHRIKSGGARHIPQLASLVGHLRSLHVLPSLDEKLTKTPQKDKQSLVLLEMGAGRGMFGLTAAGVAAASEIPTRLIMVERTGSRSKADKIFRTLPVPSGEKTTTHQQPYLKLDAVKWSRIECDLAHVNLPVVLTKEGHGQDNNDDDDDAQVVVIAKHLCGAGTDLALKSMETIRGKVACCVLATCCHGICDWKEYVGRDYLHQAMASDNDDDESIPFFGAAEFDLMRQWCAGSVACQKKCAVNSNEGNEDNAKKESLVGGHNTKDDETAAESNAGHNDEDDEEEEMEHNGNAPDEQESSTSLVGSNNQGHRVNIRAVAESLHLECGVEGLGRACQRLIDHGRLEYLRNVIFAPSGSGSGSGSSSSSPSSSELVHYISPDVSPQNACLIGRRASN